ncbi:helix-turn-helix domain-containing protein [bacterium]|nr:helix-turn-helix domain-containing protein [bacterium]
MEAFRDLLYDLCRNRGVQFAELARSIGVTKSYIGQLVHGHSKPPPRERCLQIADALELLPAERDALVNLAVCERARNEARQLIESLTTDLVTLREASADVALGLLSTLADAGDALAGLLEEDELLADLCRICASGEPNTRAILTRRLADVSPERLASELRTLTAVVGATPDVLRPDGAGIAPPGEVPIIGYVAAGQTNVAFTDAGLPAGASMPGEDPIPRWPGLGEHAYALRISGESMLPLAPPGALIIIDPDRTPRNDEPGICQTTDDRTYFKLIHFEAAGSVRLESTNTAVAGDIVLARNEVRRLQKVVAMIYS